MIGHILPAILIIAILIFIGVAKDKLIKRKNMGKAINLDFLQDYLWHKNPYTNMWAAFKREDIAEYFNNNATDKAIKNESKDAIMEYLIDIHNK
jgi:hypothetical protein